jgi:peptide-methionine (S)-S-oxide reductase
MPTKGFRKRFPRSGPLRTGRAARAGILAAALGLLLPNAEATAGALPAPALDPPAPATRETAVLAGGCFWGVQAVFQHTRGVIRATSGYAGGSAATADYETVSRGGSDHAEAVEVVFDPATISYGQLLRVFFSVALDPTQIDRQGPDVGPQYRSEIFAADDRQRRIAAAYIAQMDSAKAFAAPIATKVSTLAAFYPAEAYHQDFAARNPMHPYIVFHDRPKVAALRRDFPDRYLTKPTLLGQK